MENSVRPLGDTKIAPPVFHNSQAQALNEFIGGFEDFLHEKFGTRELSKEEIIHELVKKMSPGDTAGSQLTNCQLAQVSLLKKDKY